MAAARFFDLRVMTLSGSAHAQTGSNIMTRNGQAACTRRKKKRSGKIGETGHQARSEAAEPCLKETGKNPTRASNP
jgi:hypothetical protein